MLVPILLANLLWVHPNVPIQVFFIAVWISCVSDAFTSLVGKNLGKRKWGKKTAFPEKTVEGTLAGMVITLLGCIGILLFYPLSTPSLLAFMVISLGCALIFFVIDVYGKFVVDNLSNSILSGIFVWCCVGLFQ